jgi:predicted DNA binding CopG/RHH family protein
MANARKRARLSDAWDNRERGQEEEFVQHAGAAHETALDEVLGLQMISIRLPRQLIDRLKLIAKHNGVGYQPLMRDVLSRFANGELIQVLRQQAEIAELEDRKATTSKVRANRVKK